MVDGLALPLDPSSAATSQLRAALRLLGLTSSSFVSVTAAVIQGDLSERGMGTKVQWIGGADDFLRAGKPCEEFGSRLVEVRTKMLSCFVDNAHGECHGEGSWEGRRGVRWVRVQAEGGPNREGRIAEPSSSPRMRAEAWGNISRPLEGRGLKCFSWGAPWKRD